MQMWCGFGGFGGFDGFGGFGGFGGLAMENPICLLGKMDGINLTTIAIYLDSMGTWWDISPTW